MLGNTMTDWLIPKVHTSYATIKFTFPLLTNTGQGSMNIALSMLPTAIPEITFDNSALPPDPCYLGPIKWGPIKPIVFHSFNRAAAF